MESLKNASMSNLNQHQNRISQGFDKLLRYAKQAVENLNPEAAIAFPETGYYLPTIFSFFNEKITNANQMTDFLNSFIRDIEENSEITSSQLGLYSLILLEIVESTKYSSEKKDTPDSSVGFIPDAIFRKLGVPLVDGSIAGLAVIIGKANNSDDVKNLVYDFQKRNILSLYVGEIGKQLTEANIQIGLESLVVPLGESILTFTHAVNLAIRMALSFGGVKSGDAESLISYIGEKIPVFVLFLGEKSDIKLTLSEGLTATGIPFIDHQTTIAFTEEERKELVESCLALRNIKPVIDDIPIPINYSFAFEGQAIRKPDTFVEFGGGRTLAFEFLRSRSVEEITDGEIEVIGPEIGDIQEGSAIPIAIIVEVAGKKMQPDFEPVLERQLHHFINFGDGIWHNAQRDIIWVRISKEAVAKGFQIKHFGDIIYSKIHTQFSNIVDKVQVKIYTTLDRVEELLPLAKESYLARDNRLKNLDDESVSTFYSCLLCQSFAPNHVCIISPERTGLCGAVNWLDAKTSFEINPTGGNQPVEVGELLDAKLGRWAGVNQYVRKESHGTIDDICLYSIMNNPLTSCGCFECIAAVVPEANGVMIVPREYSGSTPLGITFSNLAGTVGGGVQSPGFVGIGKNYIVSKKFLLAEGGIERIVWMPKELKAILYDRIEAIIPGLAEKIADEETVQTLDDLLSYLGAVSHPALTLDSLF